MKKRRIVIASILKPIDDTRMLEKMAMSLAATQRYDVSIIGYPSISKPVNAIIQFYPLPRFSRMSWRRMIAPWRIARIISKVRPEVLIVNTHDLLIVAILIRILFGTIIIYDLRENYYRNILYSRVFPIVIRHLIAGWVRLKELATAPFIRHFFLAEKGYQSEMSFFRDRFTVLENKAVIPDGARRTNKPGMIKLLFSGTLAESTGVFEAIRLTSQLHDLDKTIRLVLAGYCAVPSTLQKIRQAINGLDFIELRGGDQLVPHIEIINAIHASDFGIIFYPPSPQTVNSIPTKLYEYLAAGLPILLQPIPAWLALASPPQACISVDFSSVRPAVLLGRMKDQFYTTPATNVTWESEAPKLIFVLDNIIV